MRNRRHPHRPLVQRALAGGMCCLLLLVAGCAPELPTEYGITVPSYRQASVNGTDVLADMFRAAGHTVTTKLSVFQDEYKSIDTVIWFPDDYSAPSEDACDALDTWLADAPGRTLVYVGRDFDAAPLYWQRIIAMVPKERQTDYRSQLVDAEINVGFQRMFASQGKECDWFTIETAALGDAGSVGGPWSEGLDREKVQLSTGNRLKLLGDIRPLLTTGDDSFVASERILAGRRIFVTNGSFLLNLPLVDHENRRLAARLIEELAKPGQVVFLESGVGGPITDNSNAELSLWRFFAVWPLNAVLLQIAAAGVIFCYAMWPIFGRPLLPPAEGVVDFSRHVTAVGKLLERRGDRPHAQARVAAAPRSQPPARK